MKYFYDKYSSTPNVLANMPLIKSFFLFNKKGKLRPATRLFRYLCIFFLQGFFFASFFFDVQLLEGTLSASRLFGFHLVDNFLLLQSLVANKSVSVNMLIGAATIACFYILVGGRTFCAWVCPYSVFADIAQDLHKGLIKRKIIKERRLDYRVRYIFFVLFLLLAAFVPNMLFESVNVVGIIARFVTYGLFVGLVYVLLIFLLDVFFASRAYCTYICPVGTTYSLLGIIGLLKMKLDFATCDGCNACLKACPQPEVLELAKAKNKSLKERKKLYLNLNTCTLCARCKDVCHTDSFSFDFKLKALI